MCQFLLKTLNPNTNSFFKNLFNIPRRTRHTSNHKYPKKKLDWIVKYFISQAPITVPHQNFFFVEEIIIIMKMNRYEMVKNDENIPRRGCNYEYRPSKIKESYLLMEHLIESNWKVRFCSIGSFFIDLLYREHIYMLMCSNNNAVCNITFIRNISHSHRRSSGSFIVHRNISKKKNKNIKIL